MHKETRVLQLAEKLYCYENDYCRGHLKKWVEDSVNFAAKFDPYHEGHRLVYVMNHLCPNLHHFLEHPDPKDSDFVSKQLAYIRENTQTQIMQDGEVVQYGVEKTPHAWRTFLAAISPLMGSCPDAFLRQETKGGQPTREELGIVCEFAKKLKLERTLLISEKYANSVEAYLNGTAEHLVEDDTISWTVPFMDNTEADVKLCGENDAPYWTEAVLFDKNGHQLCCTEPESELFSDWELRCGDKTYTIHVKAAKLEQDEHYRII